MRRFHDAEARSSRFKCSLCHKAFFYASDRDEHENAHRGDKKFPCHCGRAYSSKKALLQHQKIVHNSIKTFTCDVSSSLSKRAVYEIVMRFIYFRYVARA
jgi:KRAB domain-containing zinc finger protein